MADAPAANRPRPHVGIRCRNRAVEEFDSNRATVASFGLDHPWAAVGRPASGHHVAAHLDQHTMCPGVHRAAGGEVGGESLAEAPRVEAGERTMGVLGDDRQRGRAFARQLAVGAVIAERHHHRADERDHRAQHAQHPHRAARRERPPGRRAGERCSTARSRCRGEIDSIAAPAPPTTRPVRRPRPNRHARSPRRSYPSRGPTTRRPGRSPSAPRRFGVSRRCRRRRRRRRRTGCRRRRTRRL